jgi:hypothetical protein
LIFVAFVDSSWLQHPIPGVEINGLSTYYRTGVPGDELLFCEELERVHFYDFLVGVGGKIRIRC